MAKKKETEEKEEKQLEQSMLMNLRRITTMAKNSTSLIRSRDLLNLFDSRRNLNDECGYPDEITIEQYSEMYKRVGVARRVVGLFPEESWAMDPEIYENEKPKDTEFDLAWKDLQDKFNLYYFLHRIDEISGIGAFGVLLLGIDDGKPLSEPIDGVNNNGTYSDFVTERKITFLRALQESVITVKTAETDMTNPRYGKPVIYSIRMQDPTQTGAVTTLTTQDVHWSRVIHVADNRVMSELYGTPRMEPVYNNLHDIRKISGADAEGFWSGAFPGLALSADPSLGDAEIDTDSIKESIGDYYNSAQRYFMLQGLTVKQITPQVVDPKEHIYIQLQLIAIALGVPVRMLMGSEEAKLASSQDKTTWNTRVMKRREDYLTPMLVRPLIDRLIGIGVLPKVEKYEIFWPDLNAPTDQDKAEVGAKRTEAFAKYVAGGVDALISPREYLTLVIGMPVDEVDIIMDSAEKFVREEEIDEEETTIPPEEE